MSVQQIPVWKPAPFIRLFPPLCAGLIVGKYFPVHAAITWITFVFSILLLFAFLFLNTSLKHKYSWLTGLLITIIIASTGMLLMQHNNVKHIPRWIGAISNDTLHLVLELEEPLQKKNKSYKAIASVLYYRKRLKAEPAHGKLLIYFNKDTICAALKAGYRILIRKKPDRIRHHGNPGAFNYAEYAAMQGIHHQVYLRGGEFIVVKKAHPPFIKRILYNSRSYLLGILQKYIPGRIESGLAEALLIGYKDDLDKELLSAYSNTGVVHVIAISGLHLGLIYWLLAGAFSMIGSHYKKGLAKPLTIIAGLWAFSILAGASPSVLRSALMFTFIVAGERSGRKTSIFNSLAASAFLLLCFNPFWLWDTGFQLSYIAVLSLVIFMKPVYDSVYIRNKLLDAIWKLTAVTIAAQILTFPLCIYLFHQFPVYFIIANLLAIPLSSLVLLAEILLCVVSSIHPIAVVCGKCIQQLILLMNNFILHVEKLPFSSFSRIQVSVEEVLIIYLLILTLYFLRLYKSKRALYISLFLALLLVALHSFYSHGANRQRKVIVYDLKGKGIEIINGRESFLLTSPAVKADSLSAQFCFEPSLIYNRIHNRKFILTARNIGPVSIGGTKLMIIHKQPSSTQIAKADLLVVTSNPRLDIDKFLKSVDCRVVVFDGTNSARQVAAWKQYCRNAGIIHWDVKEKGAFIINLNSRSFATR